MSTEDVQRSVLRWTDASAIGKRQRRVGAIGTRLHILMPCHDYPPTGGGAGVVCHALARQYVQAGHRVCVVTTACAELPAHERLDGVDVYRVDCGRQHRGMMNRWEELSWIRRSAAPIRQLDQRDPFDVVHAHFIVPGGLVGSRLTVRFGTPLVLTAHGPDVPGYDRPRHAVAHVLAHPWWRRVVRSASVVVAPSHYLASLVESQLRGLAVHVIPNGFDPQHFRPAPKQRRILLCGRLVESKGFHTYLRSISDLERPDWGIDIVGDGPMGDTLKALARRCKMPVTRHDWLDNDSTQLAELYARAMIVALPSQHECCSVTLLEAMSAGCAVIATDTAGSPEIIDQCGLLTPVDDTAALRAATIQLIDNPQLCQELGERALRQARVRHDWAKLARRYQDLFHRQLAVRGAA